MAETHCFIKLPQTAAAQRLVTWARKAVGVHLNCVHVTAEGTGDFFSYRSARKQQPLYVSGHQYTNTTMVIFRREASFSA